MPKRGVLPIFRSELQLRLLGLLLLNPERTWTATELSARLNATAVSIHRELHRTLAAGLVTREAVGRTFLYRAATDSPLFDPLQLLLERTVGVEAELREALADVAGVEAAFIHGSFAKRAKLRPGSDVDLLVLGDVDPHVLRRRVRQVESRVGREIDVLAYRQDEFASLAQRGNSLVRAIIEGPITPLFGSTDALPQVA
jgi:predicted nucleotidyltransferase